MPRTVIPIPEWISQACELMVRYDLSLRQAAAELGKDISVEEAEALKDRKLFKQALEAARLSYYADIGSNPRLTKEVIAGQIYKLAERLTADREDYKASDSLLKLAKIMGWINGEGSAQPVLANLTQDDIDRLRAEIKAKQQPQASDAEPKAESKVN
jgi:hypothetical protein